MKMGETFTVSNVEMQRPLIGRIVDLVMDDGEFVTARIVSVFDDSTLLKVINKEAKE